MEYLGRPDTIQYCSQEVRKWGAGRKRAWMFRNRVPENRGSPRVLSRDGGARSRKATYLKKLRIEEVARCCLLRCSTIAPAP